jgi:hypothetical protein
MVWVLPQAYSEVAIKPLYHVNWLNVWDVAEVLIAQFCKGWRIRAQGRNGASCSGV